MSVAIIDYGAGNIQSIRFALTRLGVSATLSCDSETIKSASHVIFPGVGEASSAMAKLKRTQLDTLIPKLIQPVLGICLGMQLMCNSSEEGNTKGLGIFDTEVVRFTTTLNVPHMGWNELTILSDCPLFKRMSDSPSFYFVHSYRFEPKDSSSTVATCEYGEDFCACVQNEHIFGVQFHPEKSQHDGLTLLENFCGL